MKLFTTVAAAVAVLTSRKTWIAQAANLRGVPSPSIGSTTSPSPSQTEESTAGPSPSPTLIPSEDLLRRLQFTPEPTEAPCSGNPSTWAYEESRVKNPLDTDKSGFLTIDEFDAFVEEVGVVEAIASMSALTDKYFFSSSFSPVVTFDDFATTISPCGSPRDGYAAIGGCRAITDPAIKNLTLVRMFEDEYYADEVCVQLYNTSLAYVKSDLLSEWEEMMQVIKRGGLGGTWIGLAWFAKLISFKWPDEELGFCSLEGELVENSCFNGTCPTLMSYWADGQEIPGSGFFTPGQDDYCVAAWKSENYKLHHADCETGTLGNVPVTGFTCRLPEQPNFPVQPKEGEVELELVVEAVGNVINWKIQFQVSNSAGLAMLLLDLEQLPGNPSDFVLEEGTSSLVNFQAPAGFSRLQNAGGSLTTDGYLADIGGMQNFMGEMSSNTQWGTSSTLVLNVGSVSTVLAQGSISNVDPGTYGFKISNIRAAVLVSNPASKSGYSIIQPNITFVGDADSHQVLVSTPLPTKGPTSSPTSSPTKEPTGTPTKEPTGSPTKEPTNSPTKKPTGSPTKDPTSSPTKKPSSSPTNSPTIKPIGEDAPTSGPTTTLPNKPSCTADENTCTEDTQCCSGTCHKGGKCIAASQCASEGQSCKNKPCCSGAMCPTDSSKNARCPPANSQNFVMDFMDMDP